MTISLSHDFEYFKTLEVEWMELLLESTTFGPALTWTWVDIWLQHFGHLGELWLMEARDDETNQLIGIAPMFRTPFKPKYGATYTQIEFVGASHMHENLDFIIKAGHESLVIPKFLEILSMHQKDWDVLHFSGLANSYLRQYLLSMPFELVRNEKREMISPFIILPTDHEAWMKMISKNQRKKLRRYHKSLDTEFSGEWSLELVKTQDELKTVFHSLVKHHQRYWENRGKSGAFNFGQWVDYYFELMQVFLEKNWLRLSYLKVRDEITGVLFSYYFAERIYDQISGIDYTVTDIPIGHVLTHNNITQAITEGTLEYFFMNGDEPYKYSFGAIDRNLYAFDLIRTPWVRFQRKVTMFLRRLKRFFAGDGI